MGEHRRHLRKDCVVRVPGIAKLTITVEKRIVEGRPETKELNVEHLPSYPGNVGDKYGAHLISLNHVMQPL